MGRDSDSEARQCSGRRWPQEAAEEEQEDPVAASSRSKRMQASAGNRGVPVASCREAAQRLPSRTAADRRQQSRDGPHAETTQLWPTLALPRQTAIQRHQCRLRTRAWRSAEAKVVAQEEARCRVRSGAKCDAPTTSAGDATAARSTAIAQTQTEQCESLEQP